MGKTVTPKYRVEVEIEDPTRALTPFAWHTAEYGQPNAANLEAFVARYNRSFQPGGSNEHVGPGCTIIKARLVRQRDNGTVISYGPPEVE